jgi:hypothetical protein
MNLNSSVKITGSLSIKKFNSNKELVEEVNVPNLIVTTGKQHIANRLMSNSPVIMSHMAIGTTSDAPLNANTALLSEIQRSELLSTELSAANVVYTASFGIGYTGSIVEAGIFNDDITGTMLCRTTFPPIAKSLTDTISIKWTVSVG